MIDKSVNSGTGSPRLPWGLAGRLALGQTVAWGTLFYSFSVVVGPMQTGTNWSRPFLNAGLSLGLICWGICAIPAGIWLRRHGGRLLMAATSFTGGGALAFMGFVTTPAQYLAVWIVMGISMAGLLYEPSFAVVTQAFGPQYRKGITFITLIAGLASTVFIPVAQWAVEGLGWRHALLSLGALQIILGVPLHFFGLPASSYNPAASTGLQPSTTQRLAMWLAGLRRDLTEPRFVGLAIWFTAHTAAFSAMTFLLVPILQSEAVETATILKTIVIIGPMQVLGRLILATRSDHISVLKVGPLAMGSVITAVMIVVFLPPTFLYLAIFAMFYGAGNGVMTILRGTAAAELFKRERYAEINGALSAPAVMAQAISPFILATVWTATNSPRTALLGVIFLLVVGVGGLVMTRRQTAAGGHSQGSHRC